MITEGNRPHLLFRQPISLLMTFKTLSNTDPDLPELLEATYPIGQLPG
jgi:hypothetical protein